MRNITRTKKIAAAGALLLVGFGSGAAVMVTGSASADDTTASPAATTDGPGGADGPRGPGQGGPEGERPEPPAELTGTDLEQVTAAVLADYPGAEIEHTHTTPDGFEAHITTADDTRLHVQLDADFTVTGTDTGPGPGGRHGGPDGTDPDGERPAGPGEDGAPTPPSGSEAPEPPAGD